MLVDTAFPEWATMLTYKDCLDYCNFTEEEVRAIAQHQRVPEIIAIELAEYLIDTPDGTTHLKRIILDDIRNAEISRKRDRAERLRLVLKHFIATHPEHDTTA